MQTRLNSAIESVANTAIGYLVAVLANITVLPLFGYDVSNSDAALIGLAFTVISIVRGYFVRILFNRISTIYGR